MSRQVFINTNWQEAPYTERRNHKLRRFAEGFLLFMVLDLLLSVVLGLLYLQYGNNWHF